MKTASGPLQTLLATSKVFLMADLYTFTLINGTIARYTSIDADVTWSGNVYSSKGLLLNRSQIDQKRGIEVDELEIDANPVDATIGGIGWLAAVRNGVLDGAQVSLQRLFFSNWLTPVGVITLFTGIVSEIEMGRTYAKIKVKSNLELFNIQWPMNLYMLQCCWLLYSPGCGVSKAAFTDNGTVTAGSTTFIVNANITDTSVFSGGVITFTSGALTGIIRTIKSFSPANNQLAVVQPLPVAPSSGDTFSVYAGCDKTQFTCQTVFNNLANFRGFPYIPVPEAGV